jgi:hypothetical protein
MIPASSRSRAPEHCRAPYAGELSVQGSGQVLRIGVEDAAKTINVGAVHVLDGLEAVVGSVRAHEGFGQRRVQVENARLRAQLAELEEKLVTAEELIDAQGKASALLQQMRRKSAGEKS